MKRKTTDQFIKESKSIHGNRYDYSLTEYKNNKQKVIIICKIHGQFKIRASSHTIQKHGCFQCGLLSRTDFKEDFIEKSQKIHGNKYDYSSVNYISNKIPVEVICPIHGIFSIRPDSHIYGKQGCKMCGIKRRSIKHTKSHLEFFKECKQIHGDKYDYSFSEYVNMKSKISIKCNICKNIFIQVSDNHLYNKCGCPTCAGNKKSDTVSFILKSQKIHGNRYDYSKTYYVNCSKKVIIFCKKCKNYFKQMPTSHLNGHGCHFCSKTFPTGTELFISQAKKIHGDKYDYSLVKYVNNFTPIFIVCKICGNKFFQRPSHHIQGSECPKCSRKRYVSKIENKFFKNIEIPLERQKPIGPYLVDGFDKKTNTIYEFLGDYWHGNPRKFNKYDMNFSVNKSYRELYLGTIIRFRKLKSMGYKVDYIWEDDFKKTGIQNLKEYCCGNI